MTVFPDVLCPFCGCLCDDIVITVEDNRIVEAKNACKLGQAKIIGHKRLTEPLIRERQTHKFTGSSWDTAISQAGMILAGARRPLLYGWSSTSCEVISKGVELAEITGGVIDSCTSVCHGPSALAVHEKGLPTTTLGGVKNRADLVVFWGCNPVQAHPRHFARYSTFSKGMFTPKGRKGRKIAVVDVRKTHTASSADLFVQVEPGADYLVITALRALVTEHDELVPDMVGGVKKDVLIELADIMKSAGYGIIFFGMGLTQSRGRYKNIDNAISLVTELNAHTKFSINPMRGHYNVTGTGQVFTWQTGFPNAIDMSRDGPYYNPGETAVNDILSRGEADAALIIAGDPGATFPVSTVRNLASIPVIQIDPYANATTLLADVVLPTAICGIEAEGTAYRMDSVSLRLRKCVEPSLPTDEEVLDLIISRVRHLKRQAPFSVKDSTHSKPNSSI